TLDLHICGTLHSVDQYLSIKLTNISVTDPEKYSHIFIRCLVVQYVQLPLLQNAAKKEALQQKQ
uniref:Sm domain-containing protein n=1 Tax=Cebus imitator TaxID=2715852 RepID=A0A2K5PWP3_CEBIM